MIFKIGGETLLLGTLQLLDLGWTVFQIHAGRAVEASPLMKFYLINGGIVAFVGVKLLMSIAPLALIESWKRRGTVHEKELTWIVRAGLVLYISAYVVGCYHAEWVNSLSSS